MIVHFVSYFRSLRLAVVCDNSDSASVLDDLGDVYPDADTYASFSYPSYGVLAKYGWYPHDDSNGSGLGAVHGAPAPQYGKRAKVLYGDIAQFYSDTLASLSGGTNGVSRV